RASARALGTPREGARARSPPTRRRGEPSVRGTSVAPRRGQPAPIAKEDTVKPALRSLALVLFAAALAPGLAAGQAVDQPVFDLPAVRDPQLGAQIAIASHYNYWKDEGLTVTVRWQQSGGDIITLMASGQQGVAGGGSFAQIVLGGQKLPVRTI